MRTLMEEMVLFVILLNCIIYTGGHQALPPGVPPHTYQQPPPQMQQVPVQHMPQHQQQVPIQQQQQMHVPQQQQMHVPQQQMHVPQQLPQGHGAQQGHHGHHGPPQVLNVANIAQEKEHIAEHMPVPMDTSKMSEQELQFHYFKMHDADNNDRLDGCELIKSLIHWHESGHPDPATGQKPAQDRLFKDEELLGFIDPILAVDDINKDGYIDYPEFVRAASHSSGAPPPPPR